MEQYLYDCITPVQTLNWLWSGCGTFSSGIYFDSSGPTVDNLLTMPRSGEVLANTDFNGNVTVPLHDALGSTMALVNASGQVTTS